MKQNSEQLKKQLEQEPDNAALYYQLALALQEEYPGYSLKEDHGDSQTWNFKGMEEIDRAIELDPMNYEYIFTSAMFREKRGDIEMALAQLKRCFELNPQAEGLSDEVKRIREKLSSNKEGQKAFARKALEKKPDDANAMIAMGAAYGDEQNWDEAIKWFNSAVETGNDVESAYVMLGIYNYRAKRYEEALAAYKKQLEVFVPEQPDEDDLKDPDYTPDTNAQIYISIADCYHKLKDYDNAESYYRQALQADPTYDSITIHLADIEYARGNYTAALDLYMQALKTVDTNQWRYLDEAVGLCYFQLGDMPNAKLWLEKCIKKNPGYSQAYYNLGVVYNLMGDEEGAEMVLQMAVQAKQTDIPALYQLAKIYKKQGYYKEALELLEKALLANPFETTVMELKAEIYAGMGDSEKAEMEAGMAQFIKDLKDGKEIEFDDEDEEDDYEDDEDEED